MLIKAQERIEKTKKAPHNLIKRYTVQIYPRKEHLMRKSRSTCASNLPNIPLNSYKVQIYPKKAHFMRKSRYTCASNLPNIPLNIQESNSMKEGSKRE